MFFLNLFCFLKTGEARSRERETTTVHGPRFGGLLLCESEGIQREFTDFVHRAPDFVRSVLDFDYISLLCTCILFGLPVLYYIAMIS
jgi:hypothetical protein